MVAETAWRRRRENEALREGGGLNQPRFVVEIARSVPAQDVGRAASYIAGRLGIDEARIRTLLGGRTVIHVYGEDSPDPRFESVEPNLEDVYFAAMAALPSMQSAVATEVEV